MNRGVALGWLLLALVTAWPAAAQVQQGVRLLTDTLRPGEEAPVTNTLPEPTALEVGWWHYFQVREEEALRQRIEAVQNRLTALLEELPVETRDPARSLIELINANLRALPQARVQPSPPPPAPPAYAEHYTVDQVLTLAEQLRQTRTSLASAEIDTAASEKTLIAVNRRVDTLLANYLPLRPSDPGRVLRGLEIMAERTSLLVAEERLRVERAELEATRVRLQQLADELAIARNRLTVQPDDLPRLNAAVAEARIALDEAHSRLIREQANATQIIGTSPEERARSMSRQQRVVKAAADEALARVRLLRLLAERELVQLKLGHAIDTTKLRSRVSTWNGELDEMERQRQIWQADSERERSRAGMAMTAPVEAGSGGSRLLVVTHQDRFRLAQETLAALDQLQTGILQNRLVLQLIDAQLLQQEGRLRDWLAWLRQHLQELASNAAGWTTASLFKIGETPVTAIGLLRVVVILTIAWLISYWLRRALTRLSERSASSNLPAYYTVGRLSHYLIILIGFLVGLSSIGMDFTNFALVAGALAIGIGFGLQAIVNNFISGLILLFERSLKVGDFVELPSTNGSVVTGEVKAINVRSTQIKTNENIDIVVPNSQFMNSNVINWTLQEPYRRVHFPFRVAFGFDKDIVRRAGLEAAEKVPHTLSGIPGKNPQVWLVGYGENGYEFELVVWLTPSAVKRPQAVSAAYYWELETALQKYAVPVPLPQRDLHLRSGFERLSPRGGELPEP
ncbi:MAG: mechanosensitive ion channel [Candidatus Competibacterales bacterium]|nr:mechanosensitive ion channel [Candidatus Competibacterales bacterium]